MSTINLIPHILHNQIKINIIIKIKIFNTIYVEHNDDNI